MSYDQPSDEEIEWGPPPGLPRHVGRPALWPERLAPFREKEGHWGRIPGDWPCQVLGDLRQAVNRGTITHGFRFRTSSRLAPGGRTHIWACWGEPIEGPDPGPCGKPPPVA